MFQPRYIQHSQLLVRHAEKLIRYRRDLLPKPRSAELRGQIERVNAAMKTRDQRATHEESEKLDALLTAHTPPHRACGLARECGSDPGCDRGRDRHSLLFYPALQNPDRLNAADTEWHHRPSVHDHCRAKFSPAERSISSSAAATTSTSSRRKENTVENVTAKKFLFFFTLSRIECDHESFTVYAPPEILRQDFQVYPGNVYHPRQVIARGAVDTGDQVFVDKFSYNFVHPPSRRRFCFSHQSHSRHSRGSGSGRALLYQAPHRHAGR